MICECCSVQEYCESKLYDEKPPGGMPITVWAHRKWVEWCWLLFHPMGISRAEQKRKLGTVLKQCWSVERVKLGAHKQYCFVQRSGLNKENLRSLYPSNVSEAISLLCYCVITGTAPPTEHADKLPVPIGCCFFSMPIQQKLVVGLASVGQAAIHIGWMAASSC